MKFIKENSGKIFILAYLYLSSIPKIFAAQDPSGCTNDSGHICNPIPSVGDVPGFIQKLLTGALKIGMPVIALAVIYCGFLFVAARGNSEKITKAKDALMYTLIGAAILLGAWAIATLISDTVLSL